MSKNQVIPEAAVDNGCMTIAEFLEARIAEDEAIAKAAGGAGQRWDHMTEETPDGENIYYTVEVVGSASSTIADMWSTQSIGRNQAEHMARHNPARILAECAAKRAILGSANHEAITALAAVYADHPDYRREWAL